MSREDIDPKIVFYSVTRLQKASLAEFRPKLFEAHQSLPVQLYSCKALVVRGDNFGYQSLLRLIRAGDSQFVAPFSQIITKPVSKVLWGKDVRGYQGNVSKLYPQRLFTTIYNELMANVDTYSVQFRAHLMM